MGMKLQNIQIGCDPEFVLVKEGRPITSLAAGVPGNKWEPHLIKEGAVHRDNVMLEIAVKPASTQQEFVANIQNVLNEVRGLLEKNISIEAISSLVFPLEELEPFPELMEFGCEPDHDAWRKKLTFIDQEAIQENPGLRSAGGHVHIGWEKPTKSQKELVARACDVFIGLRSVKYDKDSRRRLLYGQASKVRYKPYGVEYRTPSNWWLSNDDYIQNMFNWAKETAERFHEIKAFKKEDIAKVKEAINTGNETLAEDLMYAYGVV